MMESSCFNNGIFGNILREGNFAVLKREFPVALFYVPKQGHTKKAEQSSRNPKSLSSLCS